MHLPLILFLKELRHLLNVSALVGHGAVLASLLLMIKYAFDQNQCVARLLGRP